jgi:hypothetical protein
MVETAQSRHRNHDRVRSRLRLFGSLVWCVLIQRVVNAVVVMVVHVITDQTAEMLFVQCNDMIQDLAPATSDPALGNSVLPGRVDARRFGFQTCCLQECNDICVKPRVAVKDDIAIRGSFGKSFAQLLDNPVRSRVTSDVEVQNLSPSVFHDKETVQQLESQRRNGEEVEGHDHLAMILQEGCKRLVNGVAVWPEQWYGSRIQAWAGESSGFQL